MKIALLITAYKSPRQLGRLVRAVAGGGDCFVHVDRKADIKPFMKEAEGLAHVYFAESRHHVSLEHSSHVLAILELARLARATGNYKYHVSLTGQCYPISSNETIMKTLEALYPAELIDCRAAVPGAWCAQWGRWQRMESARAFLAEWLGAERYENRVGNVLRLPIKAIEYVFTLWRGRPRDNLARMGYTYSAGSHLFILTDKAISFILDRADREPALLNVFRSISTPEESFFQTVFAASPFVDNRARIEKHHIHETPGLDRVERSDILRFILDARGEISHLRHPLVATMAEKDLVTRSRALFGRKFDEATDAEIIDYIDWLRTLPESERMRLSEWQPPGPPS